MKTLKSFLSNQLKYFIFPVIALVALLVVSSNTKDYGQKIEAAPGDDQPYSIYIIAGQSNAEGTNSFLTEIPSGQELGTHPADDDANPDDNAQLWWEGADGVGIQDDPYGLVKLLQAGGNYNPAGWIKSQNAEVPSSNGKRNGLVNFKDIDQPIPVGQRAGLFGSELSLARKLYDEGKRKIIILKVSYGFQSLAKSTSTFVPYDWYPDIPGQPSRNKSYAHLVSAYGELTDYLKANNKSYTVDGMFWLQGETDTLDTSYTDSYKENFDLLVNRSKEDFHFNPKAHFVARKFNLRHCVDYAYPMVGDYCGMGYALRLEGVNALNILDALTVNALISIPLNNERIRSIRDSMQSVSDKYDWVDMTETDDAPFYYDHIHLNASGQLLTGERMSSMYKQPFYRTGTSLCPAERSSYHYIDDYDCDGKMNSQEDTGKGANCPYTINGQPVDTANNRNLGDDDSDCDGFPNYVDNKDTQRGSGLTDV